MLPQLNLPISLEDDVVPERGGPWDVSTVSANYAGLGNTLPMSLIFKRDSPNGPYNPYLLVAPSAILEQAGAPPGMGVYALRTFKGPREVRSQFGTRRLQGDDIGYYGGRIVESAQTKQEADRLATQFSQRGMDSLLTMKVQGRAGWFVVDGATNSTRPFLYKVNDPRGTRYKARCLVNDFGLFRAAMDIPPVRFDRPLMEQAASELSFEYGDENYWDLTTRLGDSDVPVLVDAFARALL